MDRHDLKLVYLSILVGIFCVLSLNQKLDALKNIEKSAEVLFHSQGKEFICGMDERFIYIFRFLSEGKVEAWINFKNRSHIDFPPQFLPDFIGKSVLTDGILKWSVNIFGIPSEFRYDESSRIDFSKANCSKLGGS